MPDFGLNQCEDQFQPSVKKEMAMHTTLISVSDLQALLKSPQRCMIFDCSHDLAQPAAGAQQYAASHIPGAVFAHLESALSAMHGAPITPSLRAMNSPSLRAQRGSPTPSAAEMDGHAALAMTGNVRLCEHSAAVQQPEFAAMDGHAALGMTGRCLTFTERFSR